MRNPTAVKDALRNQQIEVPSWAFGNSGTRFKVFGQPGVPRDAFEKAADAAQVHKHTGVAPSMAVHIPWDKVDDYEALAEHAKSLGIPLLADLREEMGLPRDPYRAYLASGYDEQIITQRFGGTAAGWGA
jgi:L-rhamnose isomerase